MPSLLLLLLLGAAPATQEQAGSIRGVVSDRDFEVPLEGALVRTLETGEQVATGPAGTFAFPRVAPGVYTLVVSKEGYVRQVRADVVVSAGRLTDVDVSLPGEFTDMEEFVVQDLLLDPSSEASLLALRFESPSFLDAIGADLMSRAGASDAASALRLVAGASVQDGKSAVIRGLPDRYVSTQMNGLRLPSADEDKRAVELDQFPAAVIESIQVSKTFTPDQQGDASGGAVDVRLVGVPDRPILELKGQLGFNTFAGGRSDFLSYDGGGVGFLGIDDGGRDLQLGKLGGDWNGAVGTSLDDAPVDTKWSAALGGKHVLDGGMALGGFASLFYERDSSYFDDGIEDSYWVDTPGGGLVPETSQGSPSHGEFKTSLFDVTQGSQSVQWGGLGAIGLETERHSVGLTYLYTRTAEDVATLATDTRGKEHFFPGYDPNDPMGTGNEPTNLGAAPYLRLETLDYSERTTQTLQLHGEHRLPLGVPRGGGLRFLEPELDWSVARSRATLLQPDKRQFGALWLPASFDPGVPPFTPPSTSDPEWFPFKPGANFTLGNFQRIFKELEEDSTQLSVGLRLPFEQWSDERGYLEAGLFRDDVERTFAQETFSNFDDNTSYEGGWDEPWSEVFEGESHPISAALIDVDYEGSQEITASYAMADLPLSPLLRVIGGVRLESTELGIVNSPEEEATWLPPGATSEVGLNPGDGDVDFQQDDVLPSIGLVLQPAEGLTLRASYAETVARQTFKELSPIRQQEFAGGPTFIGNPELGMSALENYDLRLDYEPKEGSLLSVSWFSKHIDDPIEYVQRVATSFTYTTAVNYPEGELSGYELEVRQDVGRLWDRLSGLSLGANATFIDSEVRLPADEIAAFRLPNILAPIESREMTNAPEHLYNLYLIYDLETTGTELALFYTVQGDTLVAGAGTSSNNFVPSVYATEYGTLNLSITQRLGQHVSLKLQAKNLTDPEIEEVYRSDYTGDDVTKTSYTKGIDYSISIGVSF